MFGMHDDMDEDVVDEVLFKKLGIESQKNFPFAFAGVPEHVCCRKVEYLVEYFITAYSAFSEHLFLIYDSNKSWEGLHCSNCIY